MTDTILDFGGLEAFTTHRAITIIRARHIAKDVGLEKEFQAFERYNRAAGLSYHNRYHSCFMINKVDDMSGINELPEVSRKALVLAAMFHDFNHSGGVVTDVVNIGNAVAGLLSHVHVDESFPKELLEHVMGLIQVTEFPFLKDPVTIEEKIIRDADILQGCTPHFAKTIYVDLYQELLISKPEMTLIEFRKGQEAFLRNAVMFTEIGKREKEEFLNSYATVFWRRFDKWVE